MIDPKYVSSLCFIKVETAGLKATVMLPLTAAVAGNKTVTAIFLDNLDIVV